MATLNFFGINRSNKSKENSGSRKRRYSVSGNGTYGPVVAS